MVTKPGRPSPRLPRWASWLLFADRALEVAQRGFDVVRDEVLLGFLSPEGYALVTDASYSDNPSFLPGGPEHSRGLFPWELDVISRPPFPPRGRLLVGGVGGGRELPGLLERGYEVVAFEPNEILAEGAVATAAGNARATVITAGYSNLVEAVRFGRGPLAGPILGAPFDGIIVGWGSLMHVVVEQDRIELFQALRRLAPTAPVLTSFYLREPTPDGRALRFRRAVRSIVSKAGGESPPEGLELAGVGVIVSFSKEAIYELARATGYCVHLFEEREFPHALLMPAD